MTKRYTLALLLTIVVAGCALEKSDATPRDDKQTPVVAAEVTAAIKAARTESTTIYRTQLDRIAADIEAGTISYDTKLQLELTQASREAAKPIQDVLAKHLPSGKITDTKAAASTVRQIKAGYQ